MTENKVIKRWIHSHIQSLQAYSVAKAQGLVKLDAMENPYVWGDELRGQWLEELKGLALNRYPDGQAVDVVTALTQAFSIPPSLSVLLGNGSDELIQTIALAVGGAERVMISAEPSFSMYRVITSITGSTFVATPRDAQFNIDQDALLRAVAEHDPCCVFLASPNNPTGNPCDPELIEKIANACSGIVVVDEAYDAFSESSFMDRVGAHQNVVLMRTLSKLGLAGLRLGFLMGEPNLISELNKIRLPYNVNVMTQASAAFALQHLDWFDHQAEKIKKARERLLSSLASMAGVTVYPSAANFLLFRVADGSGEAVFSNLKQQGVLIKNLHGTHPQLADCLRVTVSTPEENQLFLDALQVALQ